jgi:hypothetical protein
MTKMKVFLSAGVLFVTSMATAGAAAPEKVQTLAGYPECEDAVHRTSKRIPDPRRSNMSVGDVRKDSASDGPRLKIDEYLSFHTRVTEDNGKFTLMPWSALRTHAN